MYKGRKTRKGKMEEEGRNRRSTADLGVLLLVG